MVMTNSKYLQFQPVVIDIVRCFKCNKKLWDIESRDSDHGVWSDAIDGGASSLEVKPCVCGSKAVRVEMRGVLK